MSEPSPFSDPTLQRLVEISQQEFTARSGDDAASATVRGDLTVTGVSVGAQVLPAVAGDLIVEALNRALTSARDTIRSEMAATPGIGAQVRGWLDGSEPDPAPTQDLSRDEVMREFSAEADGVVVAYSAASQEFSSVYLPDLDSLPAVRRAANRALASAQLGQPGAIPLDEQIDDRLEELDEAMEAIEAKLDGVEDNLDRILKSLGD